MIFPAMNFHFSRISPNCHGKTTIFHMDPSNWAGPSGHLATSRTMIHYDFLVSCHLQWLLVAVYLPTGGWTTTKLLIKSPFFPLKYLKSTFLLAKFGSFLWGCYCNSRLALNPVIFEAATAGIPVPCWFTALLKFLRLFKFEAHAQAGAS
jgi:hypothetical protein